MLHPQEAVIVSVARTAIGKAFEGAGGSGHVVRATVDRAGFDPTEIDDVLIGCAAQQGTQSYNIGRLCAYTAGLPDTVPGLALDRMCSSGLMSVAMAAKSWPCPGKSGG